MGESKTEQEEFEAEREKAHDSLDDMGNEMQDDFMNMELAEETYDPDEMPDISWKSWFTGLGTATIQGIRKRDERNNRTIFDIDIHSSDGEDGFLVIHDRGGSFTDQSEMARLLKYKGTKPTEDLSDQLVNRTVPVYIDEFGLPSDDLSTVFWRPYIPNKFNWFGRQSHRVDKMFRYLGYEGEIRHNVITFGKSVLLMTMIALSIMIVQSGFNLSLLYLILSILIAFIAVFIVSHVERLASYGKEKWVEIHDRETISE